MIKYDNKEVKQMAQNNEQMIKNIRKKLNIVNQSLINPENLKIQIQRILKTFMILLCLKIHFHQVKLQQLLMN